MKRLITILTILVLIPGCNEPKATENLTADTPGFVLSDENVEVKSSQATPFFDNSMLRWIAVILFAVAIVMFLAGHRTLKVYAVVASTLTLLFLMSYIWGLQMSGSSELFSPTVYADGPVFFSLGSLLLINTYITLAIICLFQVRNRITAIIRKHKKHYRRKMLIYGLAIVIIS